VGKDAYLPDSPNAVNGINPCCLWIAPGEWIVLASLEVDELCGQLRAALPNTFTITDISASRCIIEVTGEAASLLLAKGCGLDFHPGVFGARQCARTLFAAMDVLVQPLADDAGYRLMTDRSVAVYLWRWLVEAAREFS